MKKYYIDFVEKFMEKSLDIKNESQELLDSWCPDFPPITVMLSHLGKSLFHNYELISEVNKLSLFNDIENGIKSEDKILSNAVATGLIEALVNCSYSNEKRWVKIKNTLGPESKKYAMTWRDL